MVGVSNLVTKTLLLYVYSLKIFITSWEACKSFARILDLMFCNQLLTELHFFSFSSFACTILQSRLLLTLIIIASFSLSPSLSSFTTANEVPFGTLYWINTHTHGHNANAKCYDFSGCHKSLIRSKYRKRFPLIDSIRPQNVSTLHTLVYVDVVFWCEINVSQRKCSLFLSFTKY